MSRSKLDPNQITQTVFDEENGAYRVNVLPYEMAIELNADDGDSVLTVKGMQMLNVSAGQIIDTSKASKICLTVSSNIIMVAGGVELDLGVLPAGQPKEICSPSIKIATACTVILQA